MDRLVQIITIVEDYRAMNGHSGNISKIEYKDENTILITYNSEFGPYVWPIHIEYMKNRLLFINSDLVIVP